MGGFWGQLHCKEEERKNRQRTSFRTKGFREADQVVVTRSWGVWEKHFCKTTQNLVFERIHETRTTFLQRYHPFECTYRNSNANTGRKETKFYPTCFFEERRRAVN